MLLRDTDVKFRVACAGFDAAQGTRSVSSTSGDNGCA
jgi:hypothetical protein